MNKLKLAALGLIAVGILVLAAGAINGDGEFIILLFIPVYRGTGPYALGGGLLIFLGIVVGLLYLFKTYAPAPYRGPQATSRSPRSPEGASTASYPKHGGVVFLGPIPIVWGSDARTTLYTIIIGIILVTAVLVAIFLYFVFNSLS